ncbi:MAG: helix-turn-helix domain-containing protein [Clostridiales bacterium]|nr:helix-turn-helix domain-containing protein [Clostridiales bacterium]
MYTAQLLSDRIKQRAKDQQIKLKDMLIDLDLNINTISQISDKKGLSCFPLARIADYLDCSVDYLLGRTDNPNSHK